MLRTRVFFACAGALALALTLTASAQPPGFEPPAPGPVVLSLIDHVGDKALAEELKLTDAQVKKLTDHRKKDWDAAYTSAPVEFAKTQADRDKVTVALLKEVLTPDQHTRATQLMAQVTLRSNSGGFGFPGNNAPAHRSTSSGFRRPRSGSVRRSRKPPNSPRNRRRSSRLRRAGSAVAVDLAGAAVPSVAVGSADHRLQRAARRTRPDQTESLKKFLGPITTNFRMFFDDRQQGFRWRSGLRRRRRSGLHPRLPPGADRLKLSDD